MKYTMYKFISAALLLGCLVPVGMRAQDNRGHHQSGIIGRVQIEQIGVRLPWQVRVTTVMFEPVAVLPADEDGNFIVNLKPGTYQLNAFVGGNGGATLATPPVRVTVEKKDFTIVELPVGFGPS
jgi:hypothetical protein